MKPFAVGIITAPRPQPTLHASITSLREVAGYDGPIVLSDDGDAAFVPGKIFQFRNQKPLGNFRNWVRLAQLMLSETSAPWLLLCEDDITWAKNAAMHLEYDIRHTLQHAIGAGAFSLFLPIRMSQECERAMAMKQLPRGWWWQGMQLGKRMWGAQAMLFERERLMDLLSSVAMQRFYQDPKWTKNVDGIIAQCIESRGQQIWWRVPALVDHWMGEGNSSLGYPDERPKLKSKYFTGEG